MGRWTFSWSRAQICGWCKNWEMGEAEQDSCSHGSSMGQQRPTCPKAEGLPGKERECGSQHPYTPAVSRLYSGVAFPGLQSGPVWIFTAQLRWSMQMGRWRKRNGLACRTSARDTGFERHVVSCVLPRLTIPDFWVYTKAAILKSKQIVIWQIYDCNHCIVQVIYRFTYLHFQGERNGKISLKKKKV